LTVAAPFLKADTLTAVLKAQKAGLKNLG